MEKGPAQVISKQGSFPRRCDVCRIMVSLLPPGDFLPAQFQALGPVLTLLHFVFLFCDHNTMQLTYSVAWMGCGYGQAHWENTPQEGKTATCFELMIFY